MTGAPIMNNRPDAFSTLNMSSIAVLREQLTQVSLILARHYDSGAPIEDELYRRLPPLRQMLSRLEDQLSREAHRAELSALGDISQVIGSSLDLNEVLGQVMDQIIRLTGAERAILMLVDSDTGELELREARNVDEEALADSTFDISMTIANQVATTGEPVVTMNAQVDPRFRWQDSVIGYNLRSILCVPLRVRGRVTGVIYADNRVRTGLFNDADRDLLATFASQAAVLIENARLFENVTGAKTLMDNVFSSIASGVITRDTEGVISLFNRAAGEILQVPGAQPTGVKFNEAFPGLARRLHPLLKEVRRRGEPVIGFETELPNRDGRRLHLRISLSPLKDSSGEVQGVAIVLDDLTEQRRLESRYELFQRYLSPAVIERLPDDPQQLRLGGQRQEITSLFADLRGFTDFSQQHDPEILMEILNQYLSTGAQAVLDEDGTLDKFMGDAVVAFFNAPLAQEDHVWRAIRAALKIQERVTRLHQQLPQAFRLSYGVGISLGDVVVGNVGTHQRLDYTAVGPSVNLARRLQETAAPGQILVSEAVYERVQAHIDARPFPEERAVRIEGTSAVYELLGLRTETSA
jgi:PAS domain S-box-containing protein